MKKTGLLNQALSNVIAGMGHGDMLVIGDAGLPIPLSTERIDLAVSAGIPAFLDVLNAVLAEMQVERALVASELEVHSAAMYEAFKSTMQGIAFETISHEQLKAHSHTARAVVRTGEFTPYANVILISGVVF